MTVYPRIHLARRRTPRANLFQRIKTRVQSELKALDRIFDRIG
ncbi:hypothetical protein [Herbiconiux daphne]|uniref:Uncharacterized protein n=1 Tax=Herbiconiux daphne TaxID=2970914 RepID=A0ABT2H565_9MICO|nr:hypothetical protein [Herbiconiux daphne]MCS5735038.1 hypothetical protein [Herbiconiux daphne]